MTNASIAFEIRINYPLLYMGLFSDFRCLQYSSVIRGRLTVVHGEILADTPSWQKLALVSVLCSGGGGGRRRRPSSQFSRRLANCLELKTPSLFSKFYSTKAKSADACHFGTVLLLIPSYSPEKTDYG